MPIYTSSHRCCDQSLVLGDASCPGIRQLLAASLFNAAKLTTNLSPLEAISVALQQQRANGRAVRSLHLIAHGDPGVVWVGDQPIDRAALLANAELLVSWGLEQIALWSCHVGADADFIALLEELTGAAVYSSRGPLTRDDQFLMSSPMCDQAIELGDSLAMASITEPLVVGASFQLGRKFKTAQNDNLPFLNTSQVDGAIYGVDDTNNVWQIDPSAGSELNGQKFAMVLNTSSSLGKYDTTLSKKNQSNGIAFDTCRNDLFFFYNFQNGEDESSEAYEAYVTPAENVPKTVAGNWNIVWWNLATDSDVSQAWDWLRVDEKEIKNFGPTNSSPANAAFYEDSIWYFSGNDLYQLRLEYGGSDDCVTSSRQKLEPPKAVELIKYKIESYQKGGFGDIAVDVNKGILYGAQSGGKFFSVNLGAALEAADINRKNNNGAVKGKVQVDKAYKDLGILKVQNPKKEANKDNMEAVSLQLSFNPDYTVLYAQTFGNKGGGGKDFAGAFYTIDNFSSDTPSTTFTTYQTGAVNEDVDLGFRDLGGASVAPADPVDPLFSLESRSDSPECDTDEAVGRFSYDLTLEDIGDWIDTFKGRDYYGPFQYQFDVLDENNDLIAQFDDIQIEGDVLQVEDSSSSGLKRFALDKSVDGYELYANLPIAALNPSNQIKLNVVLDKTGLEREAVSGVEDLDECFSGSIVAIEGSAKCLDVGFDNDKEAAQFSFEVSRSDAVGGQYYEYQFNAAGLNGGSYDIQNTEIIAFDSNSAIIANDDAVVVVEKTDEANEGYIKVQEDVASFDIDVTLQGDNFVGDEEIALTLINAYEISGRFASIALTEKSGAAQLKDDCILPQPPTPPTPPTPSGGKVQRVEATSACELDGTSSKKDAVFKFEVSFDPVGTEAQLYGYSFEALGDWSESGYRIQEIVFPDDVIFRPSSKTSGDIVVPARMQTFEVDVVVKSNQVLTGEEALALTISNDSSEASGSTSLKDADCAPWIGMVDQVTGVAACEREGLTNKQKATFSFDVVVDPGDLPQIYDYSFVPSGFQTGPSGEQIEITGIDVANSDGVEFEKQPGTEGKLQVDAGVETFRIDVSVTSKGAISGEEALELSLANDMSSASGTASLADHECKQSAVLETLDGLGYCSDSDDGDTDLSFYYRASFDPGLPTLYGYALGIDNLSLTADYTINDLEFIDLQGDSVDVQIQRESGGIGTILVGEDVSDVLVSVEANATGEITGQEALTLSIGEPQESGGVEDGTGLTASVGFGDYLEICDPLGPQVTSINAQVDCSPDDDENVLVSRFIYDVNLIADNAGPKTYEYSFVPSGFEEDRDDYSVSVIPSEDYSSKDLQSGALQGEIRVAEGVDHFKLEIDIQAGENLVETESLSLTLADERSSVEATASLATSDCIEQVPDSHLYLLMNNSTSMLSPEPSTSQTSAPTMLEAQNRIAFYSFEQAAAKAGYGFRNINDDSFESFGETSTNAILSNSSESLAQTLQDYELVDDPYDGKKAGNLTVHLITYGYIVDYRREDFRSNNLLAGASPGKEGLNLAQRILLTSTPNKIYGNSIENNPNWEAYDLPEPTEDDYFPRNWKELGVNASNLYSGTEMLGAFTGLTHLLREKRRTNDIQSDESVAITVATDGRPERRPWWDNRDGDGSGVPIPLPESLGGDEITAAGLLYNNDGSFQYNLDNDGVAQWPKMQGKLNKQMDRLAKKLNDPSQQFEVDVIGLGEEDVIGVGADDVVNFPAIYDNLFNEQTFDDSDSTWAYNVVEDLPDFFD